MKKKCDIASYIFLLTSKLCGISGKKDFNGAVNPLAFFFWSKVKNSKDDSKQYGDINNWFNYESNPCRHPRTHTHILRHPSHQPHTRTLIASYSCPKQTSVKPLGRFSHTSNNKDSLQPYSVTLSLPNRMSHTVLATEAVCFTWKHKPLRHHYKIFDIRPFHLCKKRCNWFGLKMEH